ncbi:TIM protein, partial [Crypturellus soui]|nr:TIM protein [Crypturellus soui]
HARSRRGAHGSPCRPQDWEQRQEEDALLVERILLLVRNVLHVPADPAEEQQGVDGDASTHDRVLWALHISGMDDLLKFLASAQAEQQWALHVLEIISLMFRDQVSSSGTWGGTHRPFRRTLTPWALPQDPEELAAVGQGRADAERGQDAQELDVLRQRELAERKSRALQRPTRHSRFGGSYVIQGLKAIGNRDVVFHKGLHNVSVGRRRRPAHGDCSQCCPFCPCAPQLRSYSHDLGKEPRRVPKRRLVA